MYVLIVLTWMSVGSGGSNGWFPPVFEPFDTIESCENAAKAVKEMAGRWGTIHVRCVPRV